MFLLVIISIFLSFIFLCLSDLFECFAKNMLLDACQASYDTEIPDKKSNELRLHVGNLKRQKSRTPRFRTRS